MKAQAGFLPLETRTAESCERSGRLRARSRTGRICNVVLKEDMKLWRAAAGILALASAFAFAQEVPQSETKAKAYEPRKIVLSPQPVTKDEAGKIFTQVDDAFIHVMPKLKPAPPHLQGAAPVTREEIIGQFTKIFVATKPEFKFTPKRVSYDPALLTVKDKSSRAELQTLIAWGCVDKVGLLATAPKDTMGVLEFGDAVGLFTARLAELTHMPDPKYSPDLEGP